MDLLSQGSSCGGGLNSVGNSFSTTTNSASSSATAAVNCNNSAAAAVVVCDEVFDERSEPSNAGKTGQST